VFVKNTREQAFAAPAFVVATINLAIFARVMKNILDMPASENLFCFENGFHMFRG
jgi:hypothetical protein